MTRRDDWTTPLRLFDYLQRIFFFEIDGAASKENRLLTCYWSEEDDALSMDWTGQRIFCNPPFSLDYAFARKFQESDCPGSLLLLPVRTDRLWFQRNLHDPGIRHCWITGRLHFGGSGTSAFMYNVLFYQHHRKLLPDYLQAGQFNDNGKGDAKT